MDYHFDECMNGNSGTIKDYSDTANDAVLKHDTSNTDGLYAPTCTETGDVVCNNIQFKGYGYNISQSPWYHTSKYYIEAPDNSKISPLGSTAKKMTIYVWFKTSANGEQSILFKGGEASNTREYRLWINDGTLKFTLFDKWGGDTATLTIKTNVNDGQWHHVAVSSKLASTSLSVKAYYDKSLSASNSFSYDGYPSTTNGKLYIGATYWGGGSIQNYLDGSIDELHMTDGEDKAADVADVYDAEKNHKTLDSRGNPVTRTCPCTCETTATYCTSFSYDLYHRQDSTLTPINRLHTRVVNTPFDVNATVACTGTETIPARKITKIYAINGVCPTVTTGLTPIWTGSIDINDTQRTITIPNLNIPKAYQNISLMLETNASELNCSTDTITIRPSGFTINPSSIKAGETINVTATNAGSNYNGNANVTTSLQTPDTDCNTTFNFLSISEPASLNFVADVNNSTLIGKDIGDITVSIADKTWAGLDNPNDCIVDSNITTWSGLSGKVGCDINTTIPLTINPYELNTTFKSFTVPGSGTYPWLYLDSSRTQNIEINATIEAFGKDGTKTKNFSDGCAGSTVPLGYYFFGTPLTYDINASLTSSTGSQPSVYDNNDTYSNVFNKQFFSIPNTSFKNGDANLSLKFNFLRSNSTPISPFALTLKDINISASSINDYNATGLDKNATFVYGRIHAYDIKTDDNSSVPNPVEIEIYSKPSTDFVKLMPQNVLYWYRNTQHDGNTSGSVKGEIDTSDNISVDHTPTVNNGLHPIELSYSDNQPITKSIHLKIPEWLWYSSSNKFYTDSGTDCTTHPCFVYQYIPSSDDSDKLKDNTKGVNSGNFTGSDFEIQQSQQTTKKGIKVFR